VIAFVGSVFSPAYFRARRGGRLADPTAHCGFNIAVHGPRGSAWAMSEYRGDDVVRSADALVLGRNWITRDDGCIDIAVDERTSPWGRPLRGHVRIKPTQWSDRRFALDADARHIWWPVAPRATIEVELDAPAMRFVGRGYHDSNRGSESLERAAQRWTWSRSADRDGTSILYDVTGRDGSRRELGLRYGDDGSVGVVDPSNPVDLGRSRWGLERTSRAADAESIVLRRTLVDAPFYARSIVAAQRGDETAIGVHETVDLDRFARRSTQLMLPFRIRGVGWW